MKTLIESLGEVKDFRIDRCKKHELVDILFGYLYGVTEIESMAEFADVRLLQSNSAVDEADMKREL